MERIVAIILALLVILVGFAVISQIMQTSDEPANIGSSAECMLQGGQCVEQCDGRILDIACGEGRECCDADRG